METNTYGSKKALQVFWSPAVIVMLSEKDRRKKRPITRKSMIRITDTLDFKECVCSHIHTGFCRIFAIDPELLYGIWME